MNFPAIALAGFLLTGCNSAPETAEPSGSPSTTNASATPAAPVPAVEPTADMGKMVFRRCVACHTVEAGGSNGIGPNLHAVVNRPLASVAGFNYSSAMRAEAAKGSLWDEAMLSRYLEQPMKAIPGTRMAFAGIIDEADRKAIYLYLQENSQ